MHTLKNCYFKMEISQFSHITHSHTITHHSYNLFAQTHTLTTHKSIFIIYGYLFFTNRFNDVFLNLNLTRISHNNEKDLKKVAMMTLEAFGGNHLNLFFSICIIYFSYIL